MYPAGFLWIWGGLGRHAIKHLVFEINVIPGSAVGFDDGGTINSNSAA